METGSKLAQFRMRRAAAVDLPALLELLERYYAEWNVVQRDAPQRTADYLQMPAPFGFVVAEDGGRLIGCVLLKPLEAIPSAGECKRLYVLPEHRGFGFASLLMDFIEGFATERLDWIYLDTGADFAAAQSLYAKRGYQLCERYNDNPQAMFFYRKRLPR